MPLVFEKQTVWTRAMPITPRSAGIDGGCATSTVSARSEFARTTVPCTANEGGEKAYVHSLREALHYEFKPLGVYVTVLAAGFTNTAVLDKFGLDPKTMPMKPMSIEQCVSEGPSGLLKNRSRVVPGRLTRTFTALVPASLGRRMKRALR